MILRVIIILLLLLLVIRAVRLLIGGILDATGGAPRVRDRGQSPPMKLVRDPVCGTHVAPKDSLSLSSGGSTHYFCSEECRTTFRKQR